MFAIRFHWFFGLLVQTIQNCSTQQLALAAGMWSPLRRPRLHGLAGPSTRIITHFHVSGYLDSPRYSCVNYPQRHSGSMTSMHSCMRSFELTTLFTRCLPTSTQPLYDVNALFTRDYPNETCLRVSTLLSFRYLPASIHRLHRLINIPQPSNIVYKTTSRLVLPIL